MSIQSRAVTSKATLAIQRGWKWKSLSCVWLFATPWPIQSLEFSRPENWSGEPFPSPGDLPNPGIEPRSPTLEADSLSAESQGKPKNTGVSRLSFIQGIFPIQESNWGLLHCRQVLYPLNYQGSPKENKKKESSDSSIRQTNSNLPSVILVLLRWANYLNSLSLNILICNKRDGIL